MAVSGILFIPAVSSHPQFADDGDEHASRRKQLLQASSQYVSTRSDRLGFRHVAKVLVRHLVRENAAKLFIVGALQEPHGHQELAASGIGSVDFALTCNAHAYVLKSARVIH